jgi:hypothetical protein
VSFGQLEGCGLMSDTTLPAEAVSDSNPVIWLASVAAACTVLVAALANIPGVPGWVVGAVGAVGAVATAVGGVLAKARVTPWKDVVAKVTPLGKTVAGPAADLVTSPSTTVEVGDELTVLPQAA